MFPRTSLPPVSERLQYKLVCLVVFLIVGQPSVAGIAIDSTGFLLLSPPSLRGNVSSNNVLQTAERLHVGQISVPHSSVVIGDDVFSVTSSGLVVNVAPCRPVVIVNLRPRGCRTFQECGHLISIRKSADNLLMVLDAYRGVFEVHPVTGVTRKLFDSRAFVNGRPSVFLNDLVIMKDGTIILSDSSPRFDYAHEFWIRFEGRGDGRLIVFSPVTGRSKEILSGLAYPTGLELSTNGQALLVSEASRARILRLDLRKDRFFQRSYVNINLPGMPEHIRRTDRGTYWVALSYPRFRGEPSPLDQYSSRAVARNYMAARSTMQEIQQMFKKRGLAVELDEGGKILRSIHDPSGLNVGEALEITEYIGILYVGTRAQQATVRVVGAANELNVDSVVQVLRSRCKVADDKIQATKQSIEQQLQGNTTQKPQDSAAKSQVYTPAPSYAHSSGAQASKASETPRRVVNLQSLTRGLSKLHKALLNATVSSNKGTLTIKPQDTAYQQKEKPIPPPTEHIAPIQQKAVVYQPTVPSPASPSTQAPVHDRRRVLTSNGTQRIEGMLSVQFSHNGVSAPTVSAPLPNVVQQFEEARLNNQAVLKQQPQETSGGYQTVQQLGVYNQKPAEIAMGYPLRSPQEGAGQGRLENVTGHPSHPQQGEHNQHPQETSIGFTSTAQQDAYGQKPQETSTGYSPTLQKDVPIQKPQETSIGYSSTLQQDVPIQKPQETSIGFSSTLQNDAPIQKPQETSTGYSSTLQQDVPIQKPQEMSIGYSSTLQQDVPIQKPQEMSIGYSSNLQQVPIQKSQETSTGYSSSVQQDVAGQKPQETSVGYSSTSQQDAFGQKPPQTSEAYSSIQDSPAQKTQENITGVQNQKPQETSVGYSSTSQQDVPGQKPQETFTGYKSQPGQDVYNQNPQETPIGYSSRPQQNPFGQKARDAFVLGPQRGSFNQKPQEDYSSGSQQGSLNQKPQETFIGYPSVPHHNEGSFAETSNYPVHTPIKQPAAKLLPVRSTQTPNVEIIPEIVTQSPPELTTGMGGFMGFMGDTATQSDASNSGYYNFQQDLGPLSDPGLFGQIEPGINTNPGASQRKHQFLPGMDPVINFEQLAVPNDQTQTTEQAQSSNLSWGKTLNAAPEMVANSLRPSSNPKRPDMNVQDISMKGAVEIQNMQMFHPTDRPELFIEQQNQALPKAATPFEEKAQPFAFDTQQFEGTSLSQRTKEEFTNTQGGQIQHQRPQTQESQQNPQNINTVALGRVSSATAGGGVDSAISHAGSNPQIELVDPSTPLHQSFSNGSF